MRFNLVLKEHGDKTIVQFVMRCNDTQTLFTFNCDHEAIEDFEHCMVNANVEIYKHKRRLREKGRLDGILEASA